MKLVIAMTSGVRYSVWQWPADATARLRRRFPGLAVAEYLERVDLPPGAAAAAAFAEADCAIAWRLDPWILARAPRLRWVHSPSAAVHQLLTPAMAASDIVVTNGAAVHGATVAEHALALILALGRGLPRCIRQQARGEWNQIPLLDSVTDLRGSTALLVGMGHIGSELAPRLAAMGVRVVGIRRRPERSAARCAEMHPPEALLDLLPRADTVALAVPVTADTQALMGAAQFARMRPGAHLVNVGRGSLVDEPALLAALAAGQLADAALDVFAEEPLPADSALWACEKILITPHTAAVTTQSWPRQLELIEERLALFLAGQPFPETVDKLRGY